MLISTDWLNSLLSPGDLTPDEAERILMSVGFQFESKTPIAGTADTLLDVEVTSNRGDCLSHIGLAREVAAKSGRALQTPAADLAGRTGPAAGSLLALRVEAADACPRFTVRIIRNVRVGQSPEWLRRRLEAVGQRSINNVVDATNYVSFELGSPTHVFDLKKLAGAALVVRYARANEKLRTLDGKERTLRADEVVVADAERAQSLAGVMGGADSEVDASTTDVVLEVATWDPVAVRRAARRHGLRTDASHRFERTVTPGTIDFASRRLAALILELAGGELCEGVLDARVPRPQPHDIDLRPGRVRDLLGLGVETQEIVRTLESLGVSVAPIGRAGDRLLCTPPEYRPDLEREIDLVEEVARLKGLDAVPLQPSLPVVARPPQKSERARRDISALLTGQGFYETVTFSFTSRALARSFLPTGLEIAEVDDERRKGEPALRPSIIPSLLACRRTNQHGQVQLPGGLRFFETASVFAQRPAAAKNDPAVSVETRTLALLMDIPSRSQRPSVEEAQHGVRLMRGVIEALARACGCAITIEPAAPHCAAFGAQGYARLMTSDGPLGYFGIPTPAMLASFDLETPVVAAELSMDALTANYPPRALADALPQFPAIERDISFIVDETTAWAALTGLVQANRPSTLEAVHFVGTFRGQPIPKGKKSVTMRLVFRDRNRTLTHDEVDAPAGAIMEAAKKSLGATIRV